MNFFSIRPTLVDEQQGRFVLGTATRWGTSLNSAPLSKRSKVHRPINRLCFGSARRSPTSVQILGNRSVASVFRVRERTLQSRNPSATHAGPPLEQLHCGIQHKNSQTPLRSRDGGLISGARFRSVPDRLPSAWMRVISLIAVTISVASAYLFFRRRNLRCPRGGTFGNQVENEVM